MWRKFKRYPACVFCPPQRIHFFADGRLHLRPFVYPLAETRDPVILRRTYTEDRSRRLPLRLLVRGDEYELWNLIPGDRHLGRIRYIIAACWQSR